MQMTSPLDRRRESAPPGRTVEQRMTALQRANEIRTKRAELKRELKAGRVRVRSVIQEPPEYADSMRVFDVILAAPKYGRVKVNKILQSVRVSPSKTLGGLSARQRAELVSMLRP